MKRFIKNPVMNKVNSEQEPSIKIENIHILFKNLKKEIHKILVGHEELINMVLLAIFTGGNCLIEGVPGLGKTLFVKTIGQVLGLNFCRIQFTPDLMPADIIGTTILNVTESGKKYFEFQKGPLFSNIILADEINRATAKTQSALLEAMGEHTISAGGNTYALDQPFLVLATQNPIDQEGTYSLPEAQLDRFMFKLLLNIPEVKEMVSIIERFTVNDTIEVRRLMSGKSIEMIKKVVRDTPIASPMKSFVAKLCLASHPTQKISPNFVKQYVAHGVSPRGALAMVMGAKARAISHGRFNVGMEDIQAVALSALRHRIILNFEAGAEGITSDYIIEHLLQMSQDF
ncbi:AAA family ATPase [Candidatus Riflebacteria bacterium]